MGLFYSCAVFFTFILYIIICELSSKCAGSEINFTSDGPVKGLRRNFDDVVHDLYKNYREALNDGQNPYRRVLRNNEEFQIHVERLKQVNGFKTHNLKIEVKTNDSNPMVYINNPVESKVPHPYLSLKEFQDYLSKRVEQQREEFTLLRQHTLKNNIQNHPTRTRSIPDRVTVDQHIDKLKEKKKQHKRTKAKRAKDNSLTKHKNAFKDIEKLDLEESNDSTEIKNNKNNFHKRARVTKKVSKLKHSKDLFSTKHRDEKNTVILISNDGKNDSTEATHIKKSKGTKFSRILKINSDKDDHAPPKTIEKLMPENSNNSTENITNKKIFIKRARATKKGEKLRQITNLSRIKHQHIKKDIIFKSNTHEKNSVETHTKKSSGNTISKIVQTISDKDNALVGTIIEHDTQTTALSTNKAKLEFENNLTNKSEVVVGLQEEKNEVLALESTRKIENNIAEYSEKYITTHGARQESTEVTTENDLTLQIEAKTESEITTEDEKTTSVSSETIPTSSMNDVGVEHIDTAELEITTDEKTIEAFTEKVPIEIPITTEEEISSVSTETTPTSTRRQKTKRRTLGRPAVWMGS